MDENDILLSARELPHSIEAEQSVLGAIIADPSVLSDVLELIKPEYFYNDQHKALYSIMLQMNSMSLPVDIVTVLNEAEKQHIFESPAEGRRYLAEIGNMLPSTANIESYCKIVADKYFLRSLSYVARTILEEVQSGEQNAQLLLDSAEQKIYDIRQGRDVRGLDLIIIAARPGMGKTSFAMNIATNVARRAEKEVVTFNLEMSKEQLATRILSTEALVESNTLRNGRISGDDWVKLATSAGYLSSLPLYIDDTASMTVQQMKAKLRRTKNLGLVIIDYLQLMESTSRSDNRVTVISEITRQLKVMAKELNVPVILLSQLSRAVESRTDKRPMLSDLRESGSIEQDADIVLFLYREAYYNKESQRQNISECIVAKNRHGETGTVELIWDGQYTRFSNPDYETPPENV